LDIEELNQLSDADLDELVFENNILQWVVPGLILIGFHIILFPLYRQGIFDCSSPRVTIQWPWQDLSPICIYNSIKSNIFKIIYLIGSVSTLIFLVVKKKKANQLAIISLLTNFTLLIFYGFDT